MQKTLETYIVKVEREPHSNRLLSVGYYNEDGLLHRTGDEPALVAYDPANNKPCLIQYAENGQEHRIGGKPSYTEIDPASGFVWYERWFENGEPRKNEVSVVERDVSTGELRSVVRDMEGVQIEETFEGPSALDEPTKEF
ncbi:MAG: hypothetical protein AAFV74_19270 [Pseudomonadota bacterium]